MNKLYSGVGVALVTPFYQDKIDYPSLAKLIDKCIDEGVDAVVVLGTTGEGSTITKDERKEIITFAKERINNRAKLIVGTGNNNFKTCLNNTKIAKELGADGVLVVTPYYNKTTQDGLIKYYELLGEVDIPIIMYNVPTRTGLNIELSTIEKIIESNKNIYGIKESTTDIVRIMKLCQICKNKIAVYSGEDSLNHIFYYLGADGCISVTANILAKYVKEIYNNVKSANPNRALELQNKLTTINEALFVETNPIPIKRLLFSSYLISSPDVRMPLVNISKKNEEKIDALSEELDI